MFKKELDFCYLQCNMTKCTLNLKKKCHSAFIISPAAVEATFDNIQFNFGLKS